MGSTVYWTSFCGNRTEYDAFWSPALTLNNTTPDVTLCLQRTVLSWPPVLLLLVCTPVHLWWTRSKPRICGFCACTWLNLLKTLACVLMLITSVVLVVWVGRPMSDTDDYFTPADLVASGLRFVSLLLAFFLIRWDHIKDDFSSAVVPTFWLFSLLFEILQCRSNVIRRPILRLAQHEVYFVAYNVFFALLVLQFLLTFVVDRPRSIKYDVTDDERLPLLGDVTQADDGTRVSDVTNKEDTSSARPCPHELVSFWSQLTFMWITWEIVRRRTGAITFDTLYQLRLQERCKTLIRTFNSHYNKTETATRADPYRGKVPHTSLWRVLFHCVSWDLGLAIFLRLVSIPITYINPQLLGLLILFVEIRDPHMWKGVALAVFMLMSNMASSVFINNFLFRAFTAGMKARSVIEAVVFRKVLRLSSSARRLTTSGQVLSLMSVDAVRIQEMYAYSTLLWTVPVMILLALLFLWDTVGIACLSGLGVLVLLVPLNAVFLARKAYGLQKSQMLQKDQRFRVMNEILSGMKVLKLYAWEPPFEKRVAGHREKELSTIKSINYINAFGSICWLLTPYLVSLAIFGTYVLIDEDHVLTAGRAFVTLALINLLHLPLNFLPLGVAKTAQGIVSVRRVAHFLDMDELEQEGDTTDTFNFENRIEIDKGTFSWSQYEPPTLKDISLTVPAGSLVAVVGTVGSGKSSLLSAVLGEMCRHSGTVSTRGSLAYVAQQAWILHKSVKENILFGRQMDTVRYTTVLQACALEQDLEALPDSDDTEIGEKGINLSGGQKHRISLARAVYQDEDIYLLDDPFSGLDSHVGKHVFDKVIGPEGLLKDKTRLLVTHGISCLPLCDLIVVLKDGHVNDVGSYETLISGDGVLTDVIRSFHDVDEDEEPSDVEYTSTDDMYINYDSDAQSMEPSCEWEPIRQRSIQPKRSRANWAASRGSRRSMLTDEQEALTKGTKLVDTEKEQEGTIKMSIIMSYVKACGYVIMNFILWSHILFIGFQVLAYIWLAKWTEDKPVNGTYDRNLTLYRLSVYGYLGIGQLVTAMLEAFLLAHGSYLASRSLHKNLLDRILRAPMAFFDKTPLGRIMNRFSEDVDMVDGSLPLSVHQFFFASAPVIVILILICYTTPIIIVIFVPLTIFYVILQRLYVRVVRQWKRIDAVRLSPIYAHFDETVTGAPSVRAYGREKLYRDRVDTLIDESQRSAFMLIVANRWCSLVMEALGAGVIFFASLFAVLDADMSSSLAGLSVSFSLTATTYLNAIMWTLSELEKNVVSVERIQEYTNVPSEAEYQLAGKRPPATWPEVGAIQFTSYSTRYRPGLGLVLTDIDLYIKPGEKVGIVGRTGAGKSSLALALFRLTEAASGGIYVDGRDVSDMGLHDLRTRLSVIPQDPVVFSGSLRSNLDPFEQYDDLALWQALLHAHLNTFIHDVTEGLNYECGENGENMSVGQRQLLCLARALLRQSTILVLDEATAAVDFETDSLIQATIRDKLQDCTILTVAHRLHTVQDYDRIMVVDQGRIVETGTPSKLLSDRRGIFYGMAKNAGLI